MEKITKQEAWTREEDGMEETETTDMDKGQRNRWMDKEIGKPKRSTKGNTRRKIRKGGEE
jgi:hypothetical protein